MTPGEAIEELRSYNFLCEAADVERLGKAVKLGIEALERCKWNYLNPQRADLRRLPSETD